MNKTLVIEGMMCGHCQARVQNCLQQLPGVASAAVSYEAGTAVVALSRPVADKQLIKAVEKQGYKVLSCQTEA